MYTDIGKLKKLILVLHINKFKIFEITGFEQVLKKFKKEKNIEKIQNNNNQNEQENVNNDFFEFSSYYIVCKIL